MRVCPVCGNAGERGRIFAVLNKIRKPINTGGCSCSSCGSTWDEDVNTRTEETRNYNIRRGRDADQPGQLPDNDIDS